MGIRCRRQRRIAICHGVVTQRLCVHATAIIAAADINKRSVADRKRPARGIRHRSLYRPSASQLFVVIDRDARRLVPARGDDARVIYCTSVEPQPVHIHVRPAAPAVRNRVVNLRDGLRGREPAAEEVEFPLVHGAARPCYWRWHNRAGCPTVGGNIVNVQRVQFGRAVVTAGNIQFAVDNPKPRQEEGLRQRRAGSPAIGADVVDPERVYRAGPIVAACYVNLPIGIGGSMIA